MNFGLLTRALSFAIFINVPAIAALITYDGYSPRSFSDWDEALYVAQAFDAGRIPFSSIYTMRAGMLEAFQQLGSRIPHGLLDIIMGHFFSAIGATPVQAALIVDLFCCLSAYLLMSTLFRRAFGAGVLPSEVGAIVAIQFPWIGSLGELLHVSIPSLKSLATQSHQFFPSVPVLRALYTQVGFVFFLGVLVPFLIVLSRRKYSLLQASFLGAVAGLSLYAYFFAWGALMVLVGVLSMLHLAFVIDERIALVRWLTAFYCAALLFSVPGLLLLFGDGLLYQPGAALATHSAADLLHFEDYWFISPLTMTIVGVLLIVLWKRDSRIDRWKLAILTIAAIYIAEFLLMNSQPITRRWIGPYHFSLFYLHPILSSLVCFLLVTRLSKVRSFGICALMVLLAGSAVVVARATFAVMSPDSAHSEEVALYRYLAEENRERRPVISIPFELARQGDRVAPDYFLLPYNIKALSMMPSYSTFMGFESDRENFVSKELLLGQLYLGSRTMIAPCCVDNCKTDRGDILTGALSYLSAQRVIDCEYSTLIRQRPLDCAEALMLLQSLVVWEPRYSLPKSAVLQNGDGVIWRSASGRYEVIKLGEKSLQVLAPECLMRDSAP